MEMHLCARSVQVNSIKDSLSPHSTSLRDCCDVTEVPPCYLPMRTHITYHYLSYIHKTECGHRAVPLVKQILDTNLPTLICERL